jgi:hypothetical protein
MTRLAPAEGPAPLPPPRVSGLSAVVSGPCGGVIARPPPRGGEVIVSRKKLVVRDGRLTGAILLGDTRAVGTITQLFDRGAALSRPSAQAAGPR